MRKTNHPTRQPATFDSFLFLRVFFKYGVVGRMEAEREVSHTDLRKDYKICVCVCLLSLPPRRVVSFAASRRFVYHLISSSTHVLYASRGITLPNPPS